MTAASAAASRLERARYATLVAAAAVAACAVAAALRSAPWPENLGWTIALLLPVAAPIPGLLRGVRRTYAWATLCVAPYFVYGVTEVIANPSVRGTAAAILFASLAWFIALVAYLRLSRPGPGVAQDAAGA